MNVTLPSYLLASPLGEELYCPVIFECNSKCTLSTRGDHYKECSMMILNPSCCLAMAPLADVLWWLFAYSFDCNHCKQISFYVLDKGGISTSAVHHQLSSTKRVNQSPRLWEFIPTGRLALSRVSERLEVFLFWMQKQQSSLWILGVIPRWISGKAAE